LTERVIVCRIDVLTIRVERLAVHQLHVLADPVEDDDRIHHRVADDRQDRGQEGVVHPLSGDRVDPDHGQRVAHQRDHADPAEDQVPAEAERDVQELDRDRDLRAP